MENLKSIFISEMIRLKATQDSVLKWRQLERLHIIGQGFILKHYHIHFLMLALAFKEKNLGEIFGQIFRIILILPGHLTGKLPLGNIGTSKVSTFKKMDIPDDLKKILCDNNLKEI